MRAIVRITEGLSRRRALFIDGATRPILREYEKVSIATLERIAKAVNAKPKLPYDFSNATKGIVALADAKRRGEK